MRADARHVYACRCEVCMHMRMRDMYAHADARRACDARSYIPEHRLVVRGQQLLFKEALRDEDLGPIEPETTLHDLGSRCKVLDLGEILDDTETICLRGVYAHARCVWVMGDG